MVSVFSRLISIPVSMQNWFIILSCFRKLTTVSEKLAISSTNINQMISGIFSVTNIPLLLPSLNLVQSWLIKSENIVVLLVSPCLVPILHLNNSVIPALVLTQEVIAEYIANYTLKKSVYTYNSNIFKQLVMVYFIKSFAEINVKTIKSASFF